MKSKLYNIAVVGASGLVGRTMLKVLEERDFPVGKLKLLATKKSAGSEIEFKSQKYKVEDIENFSFSGYNIALFSAGKEASIKYVPRAAKEGCIAIDNGSHWRMKNSIPLVVPEVNKDELKEHKGVIANPNCSTIQLVVALKPIADLLGLKRIVVSTYQSISGAGQKGIDKLRTELKSDGLPFKGQSHPIAFNTIFHSLTDKSGFSEEEVKMKNEIRKIMNLPDLGIAVTCVRLPILGGHGESVNIETKKKFKMADLRKILNKAQGIRLVDNPKKDVYPTVQLSSGQDEVFIGRLRIDDSVESGAHLWIVADNVRKGAATNAVQIAEEIIKKKLFTFEYSEKVFH